ncbi:MAG: DUF5615 family PIN-like protein [Limisphaerales bacterium]
MKLLLDQGTPRSAAALLRGMNFNAVHTAEAGLASASDAEILAHAAGAGAVVVTLDADFRTLLALSGADRPSVIASGSSDCKPESLPASCSRCFPAAKTKRYAARSFRFANTRSEFAVCRLVNEGASLYSFPGSAMQ